MKRISNKEIISCVEANIANNVYCYGNQASVCHYTMKELLDFLWNDLATSKMYDDGCFIQSNENRFDGKEETIERIKPFAIKRMKELAKNGFKFVALGMR